MKIEDMPIDPRRPDKHIDLATGIWPIAEWGGECYRGFVRHERFAGGPERVIEGTNRAKQRKDRAKLETMR